MKREIFAVEAYVVDANGTYNSLTGYPQTFDSKNYGNDIAKARQRAYGEWHKCLSDMSKNDTRQVQCAMIIDVNTGLQIEKTTIGKLADLEPEPEQAGE